MSGTLRRKIKRGARQLRNGNFWANVRNSGIIGRRFPEYAEAVRKDVQELLRDLNANALWDDDS